MARIPIEVTQAWDVVPEQSQPLGRGRINRTLLVPRRPEGALVLQRLNASVFPEPEKVMANVRRVLDHLPPGPLRLVPTAAGEDWLRDEKGRVWRAWIPIAGARTVEGRATPGEALACAEAFGRFLENLLNLSSASLHITLPGFHHTPSRLAAFEAAAQSAGPELDADRARIARLASLAPVLENLPVRVAHYDTKLNNVLLREGSDEALAVIDLDTVQPGSWVVDFGDMARSACNPAGEDADPSDRIDPDLDAFEALARGFLLPLGPHLRAEERERLALAPAVLAFELGLRFLTDHLQGDRIFPVRGLARNLHRARVQLTLAEGFLRSGGEMIRRLPAR